MNDIIYKYFREKGDYSNVGIYISCFKTGMLFPLTSFYCNDLYVIENPILYSVNYKPNGNEGGWKECSPLVDGYLHLNNLQFFRAISKEEAIEILTGLSNRTKPPKLSNWAKVPENYDF